jgi:hypothetical protein
MCAVLSLATTIRAQAYDAGAGCRTALLGCVDAIAEAFLANSAPASARFDRRRAEMNVLEGLARMWARAGEGERVMALIARMEDETLRLETRLYAAPRVKGRLGHEMLQVARQYFARNPQPDGVMLANLAAAEAGLGNQRQAQAALAKATMVLAATLPRMTRDLRVAIAKAHMASGAYDAAMSVMSSIEDEPPEMQVIRHSFYADLVQSRVRAGQIRPAIDMVDAIAHEFVRVPAQINLTVALLADGQYDLAQMTFDKAMSGMNSYSGTAYHAELLAALSGPAYLLMQGAAYRKLRAQVLREIQNMPYDTIVVNDMAILGRSLIFARAFAEAQAAISEIERRAAPFSTRNNQYGYNRMIAMLYLDMEDISAAFALLNREGDAQYKQTMLRLLLDNLPQSAVPVYSPRAYYYE